MARQIGLKDIHIALLTSDGSAAPVYGTPEKIAGAIAATITKSISSNTFYSDDTVEETFNALESIDVEVDLAALSIATRAKIQGSTVVKGVAIESKADSAPYLALGFKSKKSNGKYRFVWLLKGKFEPVNDEYKTQEDSVEGQVPKLKAKFVPRIFDGHLQFVTDEGEAGSDQTLINGWFTAVPATPTAV